MALPAASTHNTSAQLGKFLQGRLLEILHGGAVERFDRNVRGCARNFSQIVNQEVFAYSRGHSSVYTPQKFRLLDGFT